MQITQETLVQFLNKFPEVLIRKFKMESLEIYLKEITEAFVIEYLYEIKMEILKEFLKNPLEQFSWKVLKKIW